MANAIPLSFLVQVVLIEIIHWSPRSLVCVEKKKKDACADYYHKLLYEGKLRIEVGRSLHYITIHGAVLSWTAYKYFAREGRGLV